MRRIILLSCLLILTLGCAASMKMSASDVGQLQPNEGVVFGSLLIKALPAEDGSTSMLTGLGGKTWSANVVDTRKSPMEYDLKGADAYIKAREGEEAPFVTKLLAGEYVFVDMVSPSIMGTLRAPIRVPFRVHPGKTTYIGRLLIEMPQKMDVKVPGIPQGMNYSVRVEDAQQSTVALLKKDYGEIFAKVGKDLMGIGGKKFPGQSRASIQLQMDTLNVVLIREAISDNTCAQHKVINTEIIESPGSTAVVSWTERWSVDRCGKLIYYRIGFVPNPKGGTDFDVPNGTESP
jgi:hypothetical protein